MRELLVLLVALCFSEFVHNLLEVWGMRQKVEWLRLSIEKKEHGRWPVNIDTKFKTLNLHVAILLLTSGLGYVTLQYVNITTEFLVVIGISILLINYILTTWNVDVFHAEIGRLIKSIKAEG